MIDVMTSDLALAQDETETLVPLYYLDALAPLELPRRFEKPFPLHKGAIGGRVGQCGRCVASSRGSEVAVRARQVALVFDMVVV